MVFILRYIRFFLDELHIRFDTKSDNTTNMMTGHIIDFEKYRIQYVISQDNLDLDKYIDKNGKIHEFLTLDAQTVEELILKLTMCNAIFDLKELDVSTKTIASENINLKEENHKLRNKLNNLSNLILSLKQEVA